MIAKGVIGNDETTGLGDGAMVGAFEFLAAFPSIRVRSNASTTLADMARVVLVRNFMIGQLELKEDMGE